MFTEGYRGKSHNLFADRAMTNNILQAFEQVGWEAISSVCDPQGVIRLTIMSTLSQMTLWPSVQQNILLADATAIKVSRFFSSNIRPALKRS